MAALRTVAAPPPEPPPPIVDAATGQRRSAVLVVIDGERPGCPVLFIRRTQLVPTHRGQVAFPGGGAEVDDAGVVGTALREAREELGVDPRAVEVIGALAPLATSSTGRRIDPVVALAIAPIRPVPDAYEVAAWFWVPLTTLLAAPVTIREIPGGRSVVFIDLGDQVVWGATGAIVHRLLEQLRAALSEAAADGR